MKDKTAGDVYETASGSTGRIRDPWQISSDDFPHYASSEEKLWFALNYAVLAPSTHNSQPWRFRIHGLEVDLHADLRRALPVVDPEGRELTISCGAALFHLRLALQYFGYAPHVDILPDPNTPDLLARLHMGPKAETDSEAILLFQGIVQRRTVRQPFREEPVTPALLSGLESAAQAEGAWLHVVEGDQARSSVADLVAKADRMQWGDKLFRQELASWVRPKEGHSLDGLPIATQDLGALMSHVGPLCIRTFDLGKGRAARDREIAMYSPVLALLGTDSDYAPAWLTAGQALAHVLLRAQAEELSASFLNQPVEVPELRLALAELVGRSGFPQLLLRFGYGQSCPPTARRPASAVLIPWVPPSAPSRGA